MKGLLYVLAAGIMMAGCKTTTKTPVAGQQLVRAEVGRCFGACPVFNITVNADGSAVYEAIKFNKDQSGKYQGTLKQEDLAKLQILIRQTNYANLQDTFRVQISDMPAVNLYLPAKDGKVKHIYDYGEQGTPALKELYNFLTDLRTSQHWVPAP